MAEIEKVIKDLNELKDKLIPAISRMYGSGFSSVFACEKAEEKINNAIELLKQQNGLMLALEQSNASNEYLHNSVSELGETINILKDEIKRLKEQQGISVDAFLQWCIESHMMGDASRKGIEYWINEFKTWKQNGKDEEKQPKKGEWIERENASGDLYYDCSVCGKSWVLNDGTPKENGMNYCPCCGADMRKDGDQ